MQFSFRGSTWRLSPRTRDVDTRSHAALFRPTT